MNKLARYMKRHKLSDIAMAELIGVSRQAVYNYRVGARTPKQAVMRRIREVTNGRIKADDFLDDCGEQDEKRPVAA